MTILYALIYLFIGWWTTRMAMSSPYFQEIEKDYPMGKEVVRGVFVVSVLLWPICVAVDVAARLYTLWQRRSR